jgi:guanylate kinase
MKKRIMDNTYTIIALMGKAGSGKDTIMRALLK